MERDSFKTQLKLHLVIYLALAVLIYGVFAYFFSPQAKLINTRQDKAINILALTNPPFFISYNPQGKKALVTNISIPKKGLEIKELLQANGIDASQVAFIKPSIAAREQAWDAFKNALSSWHKKPYIVFGYLYGYIKMRINSQTDIKTADFIALSLDLMAMTPTDFSVKNPPAPPKNKRRQKNQAPQQLALASNIAAANTTGKALVVEILNATGKDGLAANITRYLMELNNSGVINVDVISYGTAPVEQTTKILDHSGRLEELKNLAFYLGLENKEIFDQPDKIAISNAKIVLGKDFALPKNIK